MKRAKPTSRPWKKSNEGEALIAQADVSEEERDGQSDKVVKLPEQKPPKGRPSTTRFHFAEVRKEGNINR